jgi:CRISPR associated protein Cas1
VGFLHTDNYGKKSLVFDLIEPFRIVAGRTVVLLFTGRRVLADWFEEVPGGVALSKEGRAALLTAFNERLDKAVRYPVQSQPGKKRNVRRRDVIQHEAHALANRLLGRSDLPRVVETRRLWDDGAEAAPAPPEGEGESPVLAEEETPPPRGYIFRTRSRVEGDTRTERRRVAKLLPGYFGRSDRIAQRFGYEKRAAGLAPPRRRRTAWR